MFVSYLKDYYVVVHIEMHYRSPQAPATTSIAPPTQYYLLYLNAKSSYSSRHCTSVVLRTE